MCSHLFIDTIVSAVTSGDRLQVMRGKQQDKHFDSDIHQMKSISGENIYIIIEYKNPVTI